MVCKLIVKSDAVLPLCGQDDWLKYVGKLKAKVPRTRLSDKAIDFGILSARLTKRGRRSNIVPVLDWEGHIFHTFFEAGFHD